MRANRCGKRHGDISGDTGSSLGGATRAHAIPPQLPDKHSVKSIATSSMVQVDRCVERMIGPGLPLLVCEREDNSAMGMLEHLHTSYIPSCSSCLRQRKSRHSSRTGVGESVSVISTPLITSADEPIHGESKALDYPRLAHAKNARAHGELGGEVARGSCLPLRHTLRGNVGRGLPHFGPCLPHLGSSA